MPARRPEWISHGPRRGSSRQSCSGRIPPGSDFAVPPENIPQDRTIAILGRTRRHWRGFRIGAGYPARARRSTTGPWHQNGLGGPSVPRWRYAVASASTRQPRPNSNRTVWSISAMSRRGPGVGFLQHDRTQVILLRQRGRTAECRRRSHAGPTLLPWQPRSTTSRVAAVPIRTPPERRGAGGDFGTRRASGQIGGTLTTGSAELQGRCGAAKALPTRTIAVLLRPHCRCSGAKRLSAQLPVAVFLNQV